uniref:Ig-like domain-containing protein n=1 Tax=Hucho hucho TaxID=62062 RepID=A0A4W5QE18_9TELE
MMCETDGNPQPEFEFSKDRESIEEGVAGGVLTLKSVKRSDAGVYKCKATDFDNLEADLSGEVTISVHYIDPMSVRPAGPLSTMTGDMVELQCKTKASDTHTVQWKKASPVHLSLLPPYATTSPPLPASSLCYYQSTSPCFLPVLLLLHLSLLLPCVTTSPPNTASSLFYYQSTSPCFLPVLLPVHLSLLPPCVTTSPPLPASSPSCYLSTSPCFLPV